MSRWEARTVAAVLAVAAVTIAGCSSGEDDDASTGPMVSATAPSAGASTAQPDGEVRAAAPIDSLTFSRPAAEGAPSALFAAVTGDGTQIEVASSDAGSAPLHTLTTPVPVVDVAAAQDGTLLLAMNGAVGRLHLDAGTIDTIDVDGDVRTVAELADGRIAAGLAGGRLALLTPDGGVDAEITGIASVDALAVTGDALTVLDRTQTSVTEIDLAENRPGLALRAGEGATELTTDHHGRILVSDTNGRELLVYTTGDLILRQRFPTGSGPYAVAYDDVAERVWVTLPETGEVVGYDLSTGVGVETARYTTVRQPDAIAVDPSTGDLLIGSATGDGLQRIPLGRS
ncbi:hypothetical protein [Rhodococcus sp. HNM0569]|uniref:hypothetical protein n=1 Tax=Rhodococcus sp. HNM0569 TaxID=2716340 RepID=UPI00146E70BE|nr:hypothetical protein [Rhodococcus sp. HNM0569]NLU84966.1 hypothetical protein [Rhodococcus sp. HNM0569]